MKNFFLFSLVLVSLVGFSQSKKDSIAVEYLLKKGKAQQNQLKYSEAYQTFTQALDFSKKTNHRILEFKTEIAIANLHLMKGENDLAKPFFEEKFPDKSFPNKIHSYYYHRKAFYFDQTFQLDSALIVANKGVAIAKKENLANDLIQLYNEIGYIYERQKKFPLAITYYDKVLELTKNDLQTHSNTYYNKARVYSLQKKHKESNEMLFDILAQIDTTKWFDRKVYIYDILAQNHKSLGDSINYYKYLFHHRDEIINIQKVNSETQYNDLLIKYQSKEKDELLAKKETESKSLIYLIAGLLTLLLIVFLFVIFIRKKNKKLNRLLEKNNFLLSELNHRIKNNLQLIVSLTTRETNKTESSEITSLTNLASKIESIASLHKQLYLNEELKLVNLKPYLKEIISNIDPFLQQNDIKIDENIDEIEIDSNLSLYIGLIINELMINSIKHAFPNSVDKHIFLSIKNEKKWIEIYYSDNGIGITDNRKVKLVSTLSRQVDAQFLIENRNGFYYNAKIKI